MLQLKRIYFVGLLPTDSKGGPLIISTILIAFSDTICKAVAQNYTKLM